jgi:outer membrane protein insertion porin family
LRRTATAIAAALFATAAAAQDPSPGWLQQRLESGFAEALGGTVKIGALDVEWTALAATLERVEITVPAEGAPPLTVSIAKARVQLAWSGLTGIGGGSIHITELAADGAAVSCSREWIDAWRPRKKKEARSVEVRVDRLALRDGAFTYSDARQRLVVRVREVAATGDWSTYRRLIIGEASGRAEIEAPLFRTPFPVAGRGGVRVGLGRVEIFAASASGPGVTAQVESGTVTWGTGTSFTAEGHARADLAEVHPFLSGKLPLSGWVEGPVQIIQAGGPVRVVLPHAATRNLRVGPVVTESAVATLTVRPGALEVRSLDASAYGGRFTGAVDLAFGKELKLTTDLAGEGADLGAILALTGKTLPLASTAAVTLKVEGDPGALSTWTGEGTFDAVPRAPDPAGRLPAGGRGRISFAEGRVRVVSERLDVAAASLSLSLTSPLPPSEPEIDLALAGTTRDAAVTHAGTLRLLDALEVPKNRFVTEPISGSGSLKARVVTGERPTFKIELDLAEGAWVGQRFDRAQLVVDVDRDAVALSDVRVVRGEESLEGSARFASGSGDLTAVDVHGRAVRLGPILSGLGVEMPIDGRLDLEVTGDAATGTLLASGRVRLDAATVGKEIVDRVESPLSIEGSVVALPAIEVHGAGVEGRGSATYDLATRESHIELEPLTLHLAAVRTLAEAGLFADGHVELRGPIAIDSAGPRGFLTLGASSARVGTDATRLVTLGDFAGTAALAPEGIELATASQPDPAWTFDAFLGWQSTVPISAVLYFDDLRVGGTASLVGEAVDLRLRGQVAVEGELSDPKHLLVNGAFDEVTARVGSRSLQAAEPFPVKLEAGRFAIGPSRFAGDGASLEVAADGELGGGVTGRVRGDLDLGIASSFWSELRGSGPIKVDATIAGTLERLDLAGRLTLRGGQLRLVGYRTTLEQIDAEAVLDGNTISLTQLHAFQGGGEVSGSGKIVLDGLAPGTWRATVQAANVAIVFPEGFKGVYQGHLLIDGNPKTTTVAGRIDVVSGLYSKDFEVSAFGGASREFEDIAESPFPRNIFLDVDVVAPGNVWVRNEIAKLEASADLHIGGELARPQVSGRLALLPGGTVRFRDVDYRVEYGAIDLTDPKRMNPYVDIRGRTRVGDYEIALHVEGTADKFDYELTSTPPLSSQDIISLLVTGRTLDDISSSGAAADLPGDMAAYYFAGLLSSTFGKQIQRSLGVDELAVTPMLLKGETDPTARVTIGKRVGNDVKLVFSQDIGTAEKQTYQVVWDATRRVRFVAESDSESGLGGEAQYAQQFGGSKSTVTRPSSVRAVSDADPPGVVASLRVEDAQAGPPKEAAKAAKATKVRVGDPFERGRVLAGSDRLRERLLKAGYIEAVIRPEITRDPSTGGYHVAYRVTRGPKITVDVVAVNGKGKRAARRALRAYWRETPFSFGYWEEATLAVIETFRDDGYFAADATWETEEGPAGTVVRFRVDRGAHVTLRALRLHGVSQLPLETVEKAVTSLQSGRLRKPLLKAGQLDDDLAAVRALYRDEGFARVRIGRPRIALSAQADAAEVDVDIEEGPRFTVRELTFEGNSPVDEEEMRSWIRLAPGRLFSPRALTEAEQALRDRLDARGFPEVAVESSVTLGADTADLAFVVTPGEHKRVGAILFEGNEVTKNRTIARALTFGQGDVLSRQAMIASQQRLYRTGLFSNVRFTYEPAGGDDPASQRVVVHVDEAPPITFSTGLGYDSEDGARASLLVGYSNLFGRGIAVALQGLVSEEDQRAQLTFRRRQLFGGATDALASLLYENLTKEGFSEARTAASFRWERRPKPRWIRYFRYNIQDVRIADITDRNEFIEQTFDDKLSAIRLGDFGIGLVRDTRDDAFIPTRGGYASAEGTVFSEYLGSQADFVALFLRGALTKSLPRGLRFASFLRIGMQQPYATTDIVPLSERYFAGGSNTMRGFEEDSVGGLLLEVPQVDADGNPILDEDGNPLPPAIFNAGGEAIILFNEELHFPIWKSIRGEIFLDAGNVYPTLADIDWGSLRFRYSGGLGVRIDTPIGPIRVEYGWKLDRREGETPGEWVLAIGQVF